jgi:HEAT repeat protein
VALAFLELGEAASPQLASLLGPGPRRVRYCAAVVAAEMPHASFVRPLADMLIEGDDALAMAASYALRRSAALPELATLLGQLEEWLAPSAPRHFRLTALRSFAQLRLESSLGALARHLGDSDAELSAAAQRALRKLTAIDLGTSRLRWKYWGFVHGAEHRVEWLIEALDQDDERLRAYAFAELAFATGVDFDKRQIASKAEARDLRAQYRDWWSEHARDASIVPRS